MKSAAAGTVSGCVVWMLVFCVLSTCLFSVALPLGSITTTSEFVVDIMGPYLCPPESTGEIITHPSTSTDSNGNPISSTAYEMQCVDANGTVVQAPSPAYAFVWLGVLAVAGLLIAVLLAFVLAAPVGVLIANLVGRLRKTNPS